MNSVPTIPPAGQNNIWYQYTSSSAALVFVHGILSDSRSCWLHVDRHDGRKNVYWPELVRTDRRFGDPSIFLGGYYTAVDAGPYEVKDCAAELFSAMNRVDEHGIPAVMSKRRIVFVCHSTGGIVVRYLLESQYAAFREKQVGLVLMASPSYGSALADRLQWLTKFYYQQLGAQLEWGSWSLRDLDTRFKTLVSERRIPGLVGLEAYENHFIFHRTWLPDRRLVVTAESAGRYFGAPIQLRGTDHFSAVKPDGLRHPSHEVLVDFWSKHFATEGPKPDHIPARPAGEAYGLELIALDHRHQHLNDDGDFRMEIDYTVRNGTQFGVNLLLPDWTSFFVGDAEDLRRRSRVEVRVLGKVSNLFTVTLEQCSYASIRTSKVDGVAVDLTRIRWHPRVEPALGAGETLKYALVITTTGTEKAAFSEKGSAAGFATPYSTTQVSFRAEAPKGHRFDPGVLVPSLRTEGGSPVALPSSPQPALADQDRAIVWSLTGDAVTPNVQYIARLRIVNERASSDSGL